MTSLDPQAEPARLARAGQARREAERALDRGDARSALRLASEACHDDPSHAASHYVYGQAWTALGDDAAGERAFAAALQLAPGWPDAWVNYAVARYRQGAVADAVTAMRAALRQAPDHAAANANLGAFLRITGEAEKSETLLRATVDRQPANDAARLNLAADLLLRDKTREALALLGDGPPPSDPATARHWHLSRAQAFLQLGRTTEADEALQACAALGPLPPALEPLWHWRRLLLAIETRNVADALKAAEAMEAALETMGPSAVPEHRVMAHFDLAKFWSSRDAHARAFRFWRRGHALLAPSQPFSREAHRTLVDAIIEAFPAARFAGARASNADPAPVFVVGMPRSGTTLCEQILAAHRDVHGAGERDALRQACHALGGAEDLGAVRRIADLDAAALDAAAQRYLEDLHALAPDKARVVDKMPDELPVPRAGRPDAARRPRQRRHCGAGARGSRHLLARRARRPRRDPGREHRGGKLPGDGQPRLLRRGGGGRPRGRA